MGGVRQGRVLIDYIMGRSSAKKVCDELRPEYDLSQLKGGIRGKYYKRAMAGTNLVLIEPDLAKAFPDRTGRCVFWLMPPAPLPHADVKGDPRPTSESNGPLRWAPIDETVGNTSVSA